MNNVVLSGKIIDEFQTHEFSGGTNLKFTLLVMGAGSKKKDAENKNGFFEVVFWNQQAEFVKKYFQKGSYINVIGELEVQQWEDKETGKTRSKIGIVGRQAGFPVGISKSGEADTTPSIPETPTSDRALGGKAKPTAKQGDPDFDPFADS